MIGTSNFTGLRSALLGSAAVVLGATAASAQTPLPAGSVNMGAMFATAEYRAMWSFGGQNSLGYTANASYANANGTADVSITDNKLTPGMSSGFRIGVGRQMAGNWYVGLFGSYQGGGKNSENSGCANAPDNSLGVATECEVVDILNNRSSEGYPTDDDNNVRFQNGAGSVKASNWALDAEAGYGWMLTPGLGVNLFGGLRVGRTKQEVATSFGNPEFGCEFGGPGQRCDQNSSFSSRFIGAGPRFGANASVQVMPNLHLTGMVATSLLVGSTKTKYFTQRIDTNDPGDENFSIQSEKSDRRVVPVFESQLGMAYNNVLGMGGGRGLGLNLALGYRVEYWLNAVDRAVSSQNNQCIPTGGGGDFTCNVGGNTTEKTGLGWHGPYFGATITF